jgi:O-antigen ligase
VFSLGIYIGIGHSDFILALVGRDSTLSGRTQLWAALHPAMLKRPVLGYGYGAFWAGLKGETLNVFIQSRWLPTGADNGYVDLYLGLGALGMCAFLSVFAYSFRIAYRYLRSEVGAIGLWPVTYLCFYALRAVSESQLFSTRSLEFLLFTATTTSVALDYRHEMAMRRVPYIKPALDDE